MGVIQIYSYDYQEGFSLSEKKRFFEPLNLFEKEKVKSFKRKIDADISLLSRFLLRQLLSTNLGCSPENIDFLYTEYNRPYLEGIDFNLSHSGTRILIAINEHGRVGVDVEKIRPVERGLVEICFTEEEKPHIIKGESLNLDNFFRFWTLKESFIKADGQGMSYPLLDFYFEMGEKFEINFKKKPFGGPWYFQVLELDPEYKFAICTDNLGAGYQINHIDSLKKYFHV